MCFVNLGKITNPPKGLLLFLPALAWLSKAKPYWPATITVFFYICNIPTMFYQCLSLMPLFWWSLVGWHRFLSSLPEKWKRRTWSSWQRRPPKRFPSSKHKIIHKYKEIETNAQKANIDTLKYTNTHINRHKVSPLKESVEKAGPPQPKRNLIKKDREIIINRSKHH